MARANAYGPVERGVFGYHDLPRHPADDRPPSGDYAFQFPSRIGGRFARAMSAISMHPEDAASGIGDRINHLDNNFRQEVTQALAIKLNLKTHRHANEKILRNIVATGGRCGTLKEAVQARAAVYDESVDPT